MNDKMRDRYELAWEKMFFDLKDWKKEIITGKYPDDDRMKVDFAKEVIRLAESNQKIDFLG